MIMLTINYCIKRSHVTLLISIENENNNRYVNIIKSMTNISYWNTIYENAILGHVWLSCLIMVQFLNLIWLWFTMIDFYDWPWLNLSINNPMEFNNI